MHFHCLVSVDIPTVEVNIDQDLKVAKEIAFWETLLQVSKKNILAVIQLRKLRGMVNSFSRAVNEAIVGAMAPYYENTDNPEYLEFDDLTDMLKKEYETEKVDCIRLPDGRIFEDSHYMVSKQFVIRDGKVCSRRAGPLHHVKRTKKSRKANALLSIPRTRVYKSYQEYAEKGCGIPFNKEHQAYGYTFNPNGRWDWYEIGGRWPGTFLVKEGIGYEPADVQGTWKQTYPVPEGYIWVDSARKKDIEWDMMRKWHTEKVTKEYYELQALFVTGQSDPERCLHWEEGGFTVFGEYAFCRGDTLEEHLAKFDIPASWKYPVSFADVIKPDGWEESYEFQRQEPEDRAKAETLWHRTQDELIDQLDDNIVLVSVDYHT